MTEPRLTDVLWIHSRLHRPPHEYTQSWAVLHATRQIAKAVRTGVYPHHLEVSRQPYAYGKQHHARAAEIFSTDPALERMASEAAKAEVLHIPPGWDLDPLGDWIAHVAVVEPRIWDAILRMPFAEIDRRQRAWHLSLVGKTDGVAEPAEIVHRYADGWTWHHLKTKADRREEGRAMGHCVGSVSFDGLEQTSGVFSLRRADGRSVVTVLLHGTWVAQAYGPRNTQPVPESIRRIDELRFHLGENLSAGVSAWTDDGEFPANWQTIPVVPMPTGETDEQRERRLDF